MRLKNFDIRLSGDVTRKPNIMLAFLARAANQKALSFLPVEIQPQPECNK